MIYEKLKACLIHFLISIIIISFLILFVFTVWYEYPLAKATGVVHILSIIFIVDVVLGPLLTFIVFKKNKKTLKIDLAIIILFQILALAYGVWTVYQGKPAWIVFNADRFDVVRVNEIDHRNEIKFKEQFKSLFLLKPQWVAAENPKDNEAKTKIIFESIFAGVDIAQRPELYLSLSEVNSEMKKKAQNLNELSKFNHQKNIDIILNEYPQANAWLPLKANAVDMVVLINKEKGEVVKIVDLRPWK